MSAVMERILRAREAELLYVAGPMLSSGNPYRNIREGVLAGVEAYARGWIPIIPHLSVLVDLISPLEVDQYLEMDFAYVYHCHALLRLPGPSSGADKEVELAEELGMPVYLGLENLPLLARGL